MKKILILSESLNVGGAEKTLVSMLKLLDYNRFDVTLLLISRSGGFIGELAGIEGLKVRWVIGPSANMLSAFWNRLKYKLLYSWLPTRVSGNYLCRGYDTVVAFCEGWLTKWVSGTSVRCRKIAWVHTDMVNNDWPVRTGVFSSFEEEREAYQRFDEVIGVSDVVTRGMVGRFGCSRARTIYNIIDSGIHEKAGEKVRTIKSSDVFRLVSVGRLEQVKGYDRLVDALCILVKQYNCNIRLTLIGDGSQRLQLERQTDACGLSDVIEFVGQQSNPYKYMIDADAFVCPSRQEGFNIAIVEAMTLGLPIIATDCAGPSEILNGGEFGILVSNSIEGLVSGISKLYSCKKEQEYFQNQSAIRCDDFASYRQIRMIEQIL